MESKCTTNMPKLLYYQSEGAVVNGLSTMTGETETSHVDVSSLLPGSRSLHIRFSLQSLASSITCMDFDSDDDEDDEADEGEYESIDFRTLELRLTAAIGNQVQTEQQRTNCDQGKDSMPALPVRRESLRERPDQVPNVPGRAQLEHYHLQGKRVAQVTYQ